ncbi:hypothetical protein N0V82_004240 [Gnomoniopsis sp. IMI 355080]|nr:hypothetical protein N0V82_004240 [Gnomoniopsis sp. IMI 355080]
MSSLRLCMTTCRHLPLRHSRPVALSSNLTSTWTPSQYQHTTVRTILQLSRREKAFLEIQSSSGLISEKEKQVLATKEAKRAKFAERMQKEHGDNWEAIVEERNRAVAAARLKGNLPPLKKKNRWSQAKKDEHAAKKAEQQAAKEAQRRRERGSS